MYKKKNPGIIRDKDKDYKESTRAFGKRIRTFRNEAGYSQKELAEMMNVTRNTVINWEAGKYRPDADLFPGLCDILEITLNDLFGIHPEDRFTLHERSLIDQYRRISRGGQRIIDHMISDILDEQLRSEENKLNENVMMLDHISTKAAAGSGYAFSDIPVDDYCFVFCDKRNEDADGIIQVKGDSMEPGYRNGEYVYEKYTESAETGEDVICSSSAGLHIKRLGEDGLVYSLNKDYPFLPESEVKIIGKVLGIVSSRDYPTQAELDSLQEIRKDEIEEFKDRHGLA